MDELRPFFSLAKEETAGLKWFQAFMNRRVELEQQTYTDSNIVHEPATDCPDRISGLQALLQEAPPLLNSKLSWHRTLEKLLDGTRDELHARTEELERLKDQMRAMRISVANTEIYIRDVNSEFEKLGPTESVDSAQVATATLHKDWLDIKSVDVSVQKSRSNWFSSARAQKEKLENEKLQKSQVAFIKYCRQDWTYRRKVLQQRQIQEFLKSIPDRVQEYGTKYLTAVRDVGMVMESFANYLRIISSMCNSSGSAIWGSVKNIKPLVDANCHTEAIEFAYHQSPIRFPPIHYRNPESKSLSPSGQTILFGCPLELCTVGELKKIPPVLEYLLDSVRAWPDPIRLTLDKTEEYWSLVNELEQAWSGVEETDRGLISQLAPQDGTCASLIVLYFMALPKPVWTDCDTAVADEVIRNPSSLIWKTWNEDPIKVAVLRAVVSCQVRVGRVGSFGWDMVRAMARTQYLYGLENIFMSLSEYPDFWTPPVSIIEKGECDDNVP